ncbi:MAG: sugar porter family MFS transporter [Alphaproteobacteria bacterium]|nr:sugar porter family MFS transporter [Alphaproteobacteria bacterium]MBV8409274.1 sugar porter family MFS transporter [Alphaproteobacteria bacterium]
MLYLIVGIASLGGLLFGYETGVAAGALRLAHLAWTQTPNGHVLLSTGTLAGAIVGALSAGRLADLVGRRDVIMSTTALFTLGAFVSAIAPSALVLLTGRFVVGLGVGAISVSVPLYIAEVAPACRRGTLISLFQLMITVGILLAYAGNEFWRTTPDGWRFLLAGGALPGLLLSGLALLLVESPVWLSLKGDEASAVAALERLGTGAAKGEIETIGALASTDRPEGLADLFSLAGRGALFLGVGLFFVQQFVGINTVIYYSGASFAALSKRLDFGVDDSLGLSVAALNVLATVAAILLIDRVGRRPLLLASLLGIAAGLAAMATAAGLEGSLAGAHMVAAAGLYLFIASFAVGVGPIAWVVAAEIAPLHHRGLAMGLMAAAHWLFDSFASPEGLLPSDKSGRAVLFGLNAAIAIVGLFLLRRALPETKGMPLAAIETYFRKWAAGIKESRFVHYSVAGLATMGGMLTGYNFAITSVTLVLIAAAWQLDAFEQGVLASALVAGLAAGSFVAGALSDRFGRRYVLMSMAALFVASAFGSALAPSLVWLLVARAAAGFAIGVTSPTAGLYVAEVAPTVIRGRLLSFEAVTYGLGAILAYCIGLAFEGQVEGWRSMFGFIALPSTIYGLALLPLPESPRWLAAVGQLSAARRALKRLAASDADGQLAVSAAEPSPPGGERAGGTGAWASLWSPDYRAAVLVGLVMMFLIVFSGWDMVLFYAPTILKEIGFEDNAVSFAATLGLGLVFLVMTLVSLAVIDSVGRKPMVVSGLFVMAACLLAMTLLTMLPTAASTVVRWGQVASLAVFVGTFALTLGQVGEIVVSELYPQAIRGAASSLSHGMRSVFAIIFSATFPFLLGAMGLTVTLLSYALISVGGALYLWRVLPETKGRSLEEIADYWRLRAANASAGIPHTASFLRRSS